MPTTTRPIRIIDLGPTPYRKAWAAQEEAHANVLAGEDEIILLVEHPPVITIGRRPTGLANLLSSAEQLDKAGIELVQSDRGGDITLHSPGQIVAYPIIRLIDHKLSVGAYVHRLEQTVIATLADFKIPATTDPKAIGVWTPASIPPLSPSPCTQGEGRGGGSSSPAPLLTAVPSRAAPGEGFSNAKICAIGIRIRRGVSLHGVALNVTNDLTLFNHIIPCGLASRPVTSISKLLGPKSPTIQQVKSTLISHLVQSFTIGE